MAFHHFNTGSPKALAGLIDALDRSRFKPTFLAKRDGPLTDALIAKGVEIVRKDVGAISYRHPVSSIRQIQRVATCMDDIRPDILHVMGFEWNLDLVLAAWTRHIPIVLCAHSGGSRLSKPPPDCRYESVVLLRIRAATFATSGAHSLQDRRAV
jgi:Glycosyl transferase 4-like domain